MSEIYHEALTTLRKGGVILYPSDTVWGIGCDARNEAAVNSVYELKQRPVEKSMIVLISDIKQLSLYVEQVPDVAWDIVEFAEKPLTVVYPKGKNVAPNVLGADGSIAVRVLKDDFCRNLVYKFGRAIISTSANLSGKPTPRRLEDIDESLKHKVDYILQPPKENANTQPSTIIRLGLGGEIEFLRK